MIFDLAFIWAGLIAFAVLAYVRARRLRPRRRHPVSRSSRSEAERDQMMNSVAPVWDGNETWLVLGGGGLFAVFPLAYAIVMPALYAPIIAMLLALDLPRRRLRIPLADASAASSCGTGPSPVARPLAAFAQGIALGALVQGIPVAGRAYAGGWWDWLTPFSLLTGVALVVGYALLGATWLVYEDRGRGAARRLPLRLASRASARCALIGVVSLWTPFLNPHLHGALVRLAADALHGAGAAARRWLPPSCCSPARQARTRLSRSWRPWPCSCCPISASASASTPIIVPHVGHDLGCRGARTTAWASCWSAPPC